MPLLVYFIFEILLVVVKTVSFNLPIFFFSVLLG